MFAGNELLRNEGACILAARVEYLIEQKEHSAALKICESYFRIHDDTAVQSLPEHLTLLKDLEILSSWFVGERPSFVLKVSDMFTLLLFPV